MPKEEKVDPRNKLNDLVAREWIPETISVWNQRGLGAGHPDAQIEKQHPAPFSFTDVSRLIRFFTKRGQTVLDPFVGIGSTLKACAIQGRKGIGIELNPRYVALTRQRLKVEALGDADIEMLRAQTVLEGDSREVLPTLPTSSVDFIVTSPPYWCILRKEDHKARQERLEKNLDANYGDDSRDLGNISNYDEYLKDLASILGKAGQALKPGGYAAIVVSDFRDKARYYMLHSDLSAALEKDHGFLLKGITILFQRHKKIYPYGYPYSFVPNFHHQYILILQKNKTA